MKLLQRKEYVIAAIIIALVLALVLFNANEGRTADSSDTRPLPVEMMPFPVMSQQYGPLTYAIAVKQDCGGNWQWGYRIKDLDCKLKYYHLIGITGKRPALVAITERMPTATMMNVMLHKYIRTITQGAH